MCVSVRYRESGPARKTFRYNYHHFHHYRDVLHFIEGSRPGFWERRTASLLNDVSVGTMVASLLLRYVRRGERELPFFDASNEYLVDSPYFCR